jgi:hypothetical protein
MNGIDRFERELPSALADVAGAGRPDYLTDVLGRTATTRQRPAWASAQRWLPMELTTPRTSIARVPWRYVAAVAAVLLLGLAAIVIAGSQQRRVPPPFGPAANGLIPFERNLDIYVGDPATGQSRLLVGGPERDYAPSFSPDGTRVAFLRASADCPTPGDVCPGGESIVVVAADGSDVRSVTPAPLLGIHSAGWAPDSRSLLVDHEAAGTPRLALLPIDGGTPRTIVDDIETDWALYRPPNGDDILVRGRLHGRWGLYSMHTDGTAIRLLAEPQVTTSDTQGPDQDLNFPAYSPDGSRIYYNRYTSPAGVIQAWVMNADGSNPHRFNVNGPAGGWWEGEMAPSPDGRWVVMWRVPSGGVGRITLFPADGSGDGTVIGPPIGGTGHWGWSPDSTKLLLNFNDASEGDQGLIDVSTGTFTTLPWNADTEPDWQRQARP